MQLSFSRTKQNFQSMQLVCNKIILLKKIKFVAYQYIKIPNYLADSTQKYEVLEREEKIYGQYCNCCQPDKKTEHT